MFTAVYTVHLLIRAVIKACMHILKTDTKYIVYFSTVIFHLPFFN